MTTARQPRTLSDMARRWGEGTIDSLPNGRARVRWRENGVRKSETFPSYQLADAFRRGRIGDIARDRAGIERAPRQFPVLDVHAKAWLERREHTHRSWTDDRSRWTLHLSPYFGPMRPADVDVAQIRAFAEKKRRAGMNEDTLRLCIACASSLYTDLCERPEETGVTRNPFRGLPRSLRKLFKSKVDPRFTPYVERLQDVVRLYQAMPEPARVAYAIGVVAGPRPGEILALEWTDVHDGEQIDLRRQVQNGRPGPLKDDEARILRGEYLAPLWPILKAWRLKTGGRGLLFPPELTRPHGRRAGTYTHPRRLAEALDTAATTIGLDISAWKKPWYYATRHTMATHWLRAGHPLGELAIVLGHSSTYVTEHYAHIRPGPNQQDPWTLDLERKGGRVLEIGSRTGPPTGNRRGAGSAAKR